MEKWSHRELKVTKPSLVAADSELLTKEMAEIVTLQPHSITTSKTLNIIQSSLTRGMLTKFSDFIGNTNTEFNLCSISPRTKFQ